jgi:E3 ubiquitin-protein ligase RBBP6
VLLKAKKKLLAWRFIFVPTKRLTMYKFLCSGHFIQHCPTNGDPNYDIKRVKPPTGIPKSMLIATSDGSYALPNGTVAVLKPNE